MNCAALSESLVESELFGYEKGAFTGATETRIGRFEWANGGTLLLDEISEMPIRVQAKLLRVLEDEEFQRVGGNTTRHANVRVIATSNRDLTQEIENGGFRCDLYHRLNVLELRLPALRERPEDIPLLVTRFIERYKNESIVPVRGVSGETMKLLAAYHWPGNVRQLRNVIHRACVVATSELIQPVDLPALPPPATSVPTVWLEMRLDEVERHVILTTLERHNGNKTAAAERLGVTARTLTNKIKHYREQGLIK
jgi:transcriptional regulator with PAS, ATPase and Fis domain